MWPIVGRNHRLASFHPPAELNFLSLFYSSTHPCLNQFETVITRILVELARNARVKQLLCPCLRRRAKMLGGARSVTPADDGAGVDRHSALARERSSSAPSPTTGRAKRRVGRSTLHRGHSILLDSHTAQAVAETRHEHVMEGEKKRQQEKLRARLSFAKKRFSQEGMLAPGDLGRIHENAVPLYPAAESAARRGVAAETERASDSDEDSGDAGLRMTASEASDDFAKDETVAVDAMEATGAASGALTSWVATRDGFADGEAGTISGDEIALFRDLLRNAALPTVVDALFAQSDAPRRVEAGARDPGDGVVCADFVEIVGGLLPAASSAALAFFFDVVLRCADAERAYTSDVLRWKPQPPFRIESVWRPSETNPCAAVGMLFISLFLLCLLLYFWLLIYSFVCFTLSFPNPQLPPRTPLRTPPRTPPRGA